MQLLDATLALALTLAALATIVTIIMEMGMRTARMRKKNLVEVMRLLNKELDNGLFKDLDADERWRFICKVIENPAKTGHTTRESTSAKRKQNEADLNRSLDLIGHDKSSAKKTVNGLFVSVRNLVFDPERAKLYDKVSLEHVLRRLVEINKVKERTVAGRKKARTELNRLARKYEEYGSAVSASFKRSAQAWSIVVGILFAVAANVDGLRIFDAYRTDPDLVKAIIEQQQDLISGYSGVEQRQQQYENAQREFDAAKTAVGNAEKALASAKAENDKSDLENALAEKKMVLSQARARLDSIDSVNQIRQNAEQAQQQLGKLVAIGVPIGWTFYPRCPDTEAGDTWKSADPRCRLADENSRWHRAGTFLQWLFTVVLTGFLIGLGAPFWFDVAKRLAQVRQGSRQNASDEVSMSGNNANGNAVARKKIVRTIVNDVTLESRRKQ